MTTAIAPSLFSPARLTRHGQQRSPFLSNHRPLSGGRGVLGGYVDLEGRAHEIIARTAVGGSVLVIDRDAVTLGGRCLVAHLGGDEPAENARLVCEHYLADERRWCRKVTAEDLAVVPFPEEELSGLLTGSARQTNGVEDPAVVLDRHRRSY